MTKMPILLATPMVATISQKIKLPGSEIKYTSDNDKEVPESKASQRVESPTENDDDRYRDKNSIKNKFGLGAEAETWDNESYDEDDSVD